jgi:alkanesulfonate monooxygenase SsuD/methylene tetrahydromethanopterin reductase-like flavin-dependent oxidoreductase (luciferase family)
MGRYTRSMQARYGNEAGDRRPPLAGAPDEVIEQVQRYIDAGVRMFIVRFMGDDFSSEARLFAEEVAPSFT